MAKKRSDGPSKKKESKAVEVAANQLEPKPGIGKDGRPYKGGNTREDGSYIVGDRRPPTETQFKEGDGRERGRRPKGTKNLATEWREELDSKVPVVENGKRKKISKRRATIKQTIKRGMEGSDRAAETVFRYAEQSEKRDPGLQADDHDIIAAWLEGMLNGGDSDDADLIDEGDKGEESGNG